MTLGADTVIRTAAPHAISVLQRRLQFVEQQAEVLQQELDGLATRRQLAPGSDDPQVLAPPLWDPAFLVC